MILYGGTESHIFVFLYRNYIIFVLIIKVNILCRSLQFLIIIRDLWGYSILMIRLFRNILDCSLLFILVSTINIRFLMRIRLVKDSCMQLLNPVKKSINIYGCWLRLGQIWRQFKSYLNSVKICLNLKIKIFWLKYCCLSWLSLSIMSFFKRICRFFILWWIIICSRIFSC
jgi:hypothetical protein